MNWFPIHSYNSSMFTLIYLCKVDDAIKARLEETMLLVVHLISCCELVWCLCVEEASSYQMVSIIGRFCVHIVHIIRFLTFGWRELSFYFPPVGVNPIKLKTMNNLSINNFLVIQLII